MYKNGGINKKTMCKIKMKTLTPKQIVDLNPCEGYDLKQVTELFDNKKSVTYLEILNTDKIPPIDIVWLFCQPTILECEIKNQWIEVIVTRAVTNYALHCGVDTVEKWAENWLNGDDRTYDSASYIVNNTIVTYAARYTANAARYAAYDATRIAVNNFTAGYTDNAVDVFAGAAAYNATDHAAHAANFAADAAYADAAAAAADTYATARKNEYKQQVQDLKDILQGEV